MNSAIILHGTQGSPNGNWFHWLEKELEARGFNVWVPQLPNADKPSLREWSTFVIRNCPFTINENTLVIGHSSGAIAALILAQDNMEKIGGIVDVSVFHDNSLNWDANSRLFDVYFEWDAIQQGVNKLLFIHSDNDPYVPLSQAQYVADHCKAELLLISGQGHFNLEQSEDYKQFPKLLEILEQKDFVSKLS